MNISRAATAQKKQSLFLLTVSASFLALIPTFWAAWISNSVVLQADFLRSAAEFLAILASFWVLQRTRRRQAHSYNFGLGKLEHVAGVLVAAALFVAFLLVLLSALSRFKNPEPLESLTLGLVVTVFSVMGNAYVWLRSVYLLRTEESPLLNSQRYLFRAKTFASCVVLVSLLITGLGKEYYWTQFSDPVASLIIALFLLYSAYASASTSMRDLLDCAIEETLQMDILAVLLECENDYKMFYGVRSRRAGGRVYIQIFLGFPDDLQISKVLAATDRIAQTIQARIDGSEVIIVPVNAMPRVLEPLHLPQLN